MKELSICFLGTGKINHKHIGIVRNLYPNASLAIASRNLDRSLEVKRELGLKYAFESYETAIKSSYINFVVGVPPRAHLWLIQLILDNGKNVLIEKPVFNSFSEFKKIWPRISDYSGTIMVAENSHFSPFHKALKDILQKEDLGRPLYLEMNRLGRSKIQGWRTDPEEMPLGALHEGGVHWIRRLLDMASVFEDEVSGGVLAVKAFSPYHRLLNVPGEDTTIVVARHKSGLVSRLFHSWAVPRRFVGFDMSKVFFAKGAVYFDSRSLFGFVYKKNRRKIICPRIFDAQGYRAMWRSYLSSVIEEKPLELSMTTIYNDFAYLDAAYRSLKSNNEEIPENIRCQANNR